MGESCVREQHFDRLLCVFYLSSLLSSIIRLEWRAQLLSDIRNTRVSVTYFYCSHKSIWSFFQFSTFFCDNGASGVCMYVLVSNDNGRSNRSSWCLYSHGSAGPTLVRCAIYFV